jgi:signal transduction histidine kinase
MSTNNVEQSEVKSRSKTLNRMVEISLLLNSSLSIDAILTQLMDATVEIVHCESASVILMDENTQQLHFVAMPTTDAESSQKLKRIPIPLEKSIAGAIILENKAVVTNDTSQDPRHYSQTDSALGFKTRSLLGVPMRIKDRVIGALEAVNKIGGEWGEKDQHDLEVLASQAAIALENAQLIRKLRNANEELSQLDKLKTDFIAIASHELRTPLGVIMGYASFLKAEAQGELSDHATAVLNSALRMRNLIEDMTNLRFLKLKDIELAVEEVPADDIAQLAGSDVVSMAETRGHSLRVLPSDSENLLVNGDRAKLLMALTNILNNAIKFTPERGTIKIRCVERPNEVWIQVKDNGVGIPQEDLTRIFEPFYQVEDHMTRRHGGMGLGLAIAKAVIEVHHGRIWVESPGTNQGSVFTISLPKAYPEDPEALKRITRH